MAKVIIALALSEVSALVLYDINRLQPDRLINPGEAVTIELGGDMAYGLREGPALPPKPLAEVVEWRHLDQRAKTTLAEADAAARVAAQMQAQAASSSLQEDIDRAEAAQDEAAAAKSRAEQAAKDAEAAAQTADRAVSVEHERQNAATRLLQQLADAQAGKPAAPSSSPSPIADSSSSAAPSAPAPTGAGGLP